MALTHTEFNTVENKIEELNTYINVINPDIPTFTKKTWVTTDFPYIQEINRIELGIKDLVDYYITIPCYSGKEWLETPTSYGVLKAFSRTNDYNRWLSNLDCVDLYKDKAEIRYCGEGYSGDTIWL